MIRKLSFISMLFPFLLACGAANNSGIAQGFAKIDKAKLADHVRESYDIPAFVKIDFTEPRKAQVEGMTTYTVLLQVGQGIQKRTIQVSGDGRFYFLGEFQDLTFDAVADRRSKLKLENAVARGPKGAPIEIVEFTDFQCPYCQRGYKIMTESIMKDYDGKVRWYFKSLPLVQIHPWAKPAHQAAECARLQGDDKFWTLHDKIFDAQRAITIANHEGKIEELAKGSGIDMGKFQKCVDGRDTIKNVEADMAEADGLGFQSAPLFVVNGRLVKGADYNGLKVIIEDELAKLAEKKPSVEKGKKAEKEK
ncbi:MAG: hypothetical protein COB53_06620 [Elusimicrobia bacterium]|nr:MAG: hypothetical protein COB53_06620 [Elusimicrobiota bacterium]